MASLKLGSKSEVFHLSGHTWLCKTGLKPDVMIQVVDESFHLHKFPLLSRSGYLETLFSKASETTCVAQLHDIPGGPETFLLVAKFCYGVRIEVTPENAVSLRCAAEYLQMSENYGDANLIYLTESFLNDHVFVNWEDSIKALEKSCEPKVLPLAEELHIVSRCIGSLAMKACAEDNTSFFNWPISLPEGTTTTTIYWNGIQTKATSENWWFNDVSSFLDLPMYKRFIKTVESRGVNAGIIAASVTHYAKRNLPLLGCSRKSGSPSEEGTNYGDDMYYSHEEQRSLLEEIVELLPGKKCVTSTKFLLRLLRTSMVLHASQVTQETLEKRIGMQLDEAALEDLLIPNMKYSGETLYDTDSVQRILDHFMLTFDSSIVEEKQMMGDSHPLKSITKVASLIDGYLAEVASDENLKLSKFQALGALIPEDVRPMDDGIYRAIDIYIKAHPWLTESEREQLCLLMNCQKLSLEACTHAAQNERLPLRVIVQVLFFEQMRLRTSIAGWLFGSEENNDTSGALEGNKNTNANMVMHGMRERVFELEKECMSMKQDLDKLVKTKEGRNFFSKIFGSRSKTKTSPCGKGGEDALVIPETKN
ncbi:putative BTB/POZ domain-containing protein [Arabidopsis thaliana]|uniref:Putative BTB/POZ domain-containing protein At5g13600 n=4 Tax=Arabidopsis TaxID=3701 RepID=Y5360_ARATH|nr:Phototropic-responsive NPH3 family protein [Arabidopsis thaliana]Q9FNB3.1 RecName: Full=Putative BTB/POZ domain-containing protein At5g13600 [Arabidopsis thaliana]KAG7602134.1 SKP1/BTB/POZ domain superfamily [Arabidopsis thaliana x Arabidopsis arenosa]KAG7609086.1 SKP1/BTB/POZ domain superfamily [Arabidopsis suecica]AED91916.1 Phototropic-responsive NPH3 family protein [Arabidopsis thaliana]OAO95867.1 hypothetical protein AXX17_AT5G13020 [Arabidopsis thaliana]CAA0402385.1 unnamed protein p|eukprot:NP_196864.1 Phototropic-responsive NPH3 family protein [Arabidopsis thaliana]